jgi:acetoin utilization deacetylase AcuC-like enzyme
LAASYAKGARPNVYWPARIMHASEGGWDAIGGGSSGNGGGSSNGGTGLNVGGSSVRRNMSRQKVDVVFLAPYWKQDEGSGRTTTTLAAMDESTFNAVPLFQVESVDAVDDVLKEYPYAWSDGIDLTQLTKAFRFTGLPRAALPRYINAHRLAAALRNYAKHNIPNSGTANDRATAGLFETHSMSVKTPNFPSVILHLPFDYILSQLPRSLDDGLLGSSRQSNNSHVMEPVLNLGSMVKAMNPPHSWGAAGNKADEDLDQNGQSTPDKNLSPASLWTKMGEPSSEMDANPTQPIDEFMKDFPALNDIFNQYFSSPPLVGPLGTLSVFLLLMENLKDGKEMDTPTRQTRLQGLITTWASWKRQGEDNLAYLLRNRAKPAIVLWRRAAEKLYRLFLTMLGDDKNLGSGLSVVISDTRCNGHRTSGGCFERPVRLPAALKGARLAGVGSNNSSRLITEVPARYIDMVESKLLARAHTSQYLKRMKSRCAAASSDDEVLVLTDNSEGEGGTDTSKFVMKVLKWFCVCVANTHPSHNVVPCETLGMAVGSRGTWLAAVTGVAAAVAAADMVVHGHCVNAFCMARPPGHHAGRSIHAMKAVSNGYCVLNAVAVTALYAVTAVAEGGLGLGRVCVLDFDAHHGNGTQDILCSTYDPRFFYVSLHAGGAQVNGHPKEDDPNHELHDLSDDRKQSGIYPGRCGDTSPHAGVLNIPMGPRVTGQAVGQVLIERVLPQIEAFSPDLLILSAGFDAHKSDPMELGTLSAADFGHITELACDVAFKTCSGRVVSVLEGGYGVPCCRIQKDTFLPKVSPPTENVRQENLPQAAAQNPVAPPEAAAVARLESGIANSESNAISKSATSAFTVVRKPTKLIDLGDDLPDDMDDQVPAALQNRLEKCHAEGFVECVSEHVKSLLGHNKAKQN